MPDVLAAAIAAYQDLGCWEGGIAIPEDLYEQALTVFEHAGEIRRRHAYGEVCTPEIFDARILGRASGSATTGAVARSTDAR